MLVVTDLFRDTLVGDIEDILHDLNKIRTAVFQLLENGRQYWIEDNDHRYADPFIADVRGFFRASLSLRPSSATGTAYFMPTQSVI